MINKFGKLTLLCLTLEHSLTLFQMKKESLILLLAIAPTLVFAQDYRGEESPPIILKPVDPGAGARPHDTLSQTVTCFYAYVPALPKSLSLNAPPLAPQQLTHFLTSFADEVY